MSKDDQALALDVVPPPELAIQKGKGVEHCCCISTKARQFQRHKNELSSILVSFYAPILVHLCKKVLPSPAKTGLLP
jgi:hypothetical protein